MKNSIQDLATQTRRPNYDISPDILGRWSPRAMTGESLSDEELYPLFEAARWAPSSYNNQPWRFIIARREDEDDFKKLYELMIEFNQSWTKDAAALVVVVSNTKMEYNGKENPTHSFDTGSAWENLAIEGARRGLVVHGMSGFDFDQAKKDLNVPDEYTVQMMFAVGKLAPKDNLPEEMQQNESPSNRRPLKEIIFKAEFGKGIESISKEADAI